MSAPAGGANSNVAKADKYQILFEREMGTRSSSIAGK
jgi:hypothetical protein